MEDKPDKVAVVQHDDIQHLLSTRQSPEAGSSHSEMQGENSRNDEVTQSEQPQSTDADTEEAKTTEESQHHEKTGQPGHTSKTVNERINDLNTSYYDLKDHITRLTPEFLKNSGKDLLRAQQSEMDTIKAIYDKEYAQLDTTTVSADNAKALIGQKATMDMYESHYTALFKVHELQEDMKSASERPDVKLVAEPELCKV